MKINCSAEKGVMEHEECLACALRQDNTCGYDYIVLKNLFAANSQDRSGSVHVTDLTGCLRKSYYDKTIKTPTFPHEMLNRSVGTWIHSILEGNDPLVESEVPLSILGLVGTADAIYEEGRLLDLKTTRWLYPNKVPYGSHELQVNIYGYMRKKAGFPINTLQIQYIDLSGPTKCRKCRVSMQMIDGVVQCPTCGNVPKSGGHLGCVIVDIPIYAEEHVEEIVERRVGELQSALDTDFAPEKEPGWLCAYCDHVEECKPDG